MFTGSGDAVTMINREIEVKGTLSKRLASIIAIANCLLRFLLQS